MNMLRRLLPPALLIAALMSLGVTEAALSARLGLGSLSPHWQSAFHFTAYLSIAWFLSRLTNIALSSLRPRSRPVPKLVRDLISGLLFLVAIISGAMLMLGHGAGGALAGSGVVLALLGFAIRNVVADTLSGIALGLEGSFRIGDWVHIENLARGRVVEIGWRTSRLLTRDFTYVILPNSQISRQRIVNYSAPSPVFRTQMELVLDHAVPSADGAEMLRVALQKSPLIKQMPPPDVRIQSIDSDGVHYALRYWLERFDDEVDARDAVWRQVDLALRGAGATTPQQHITIHQTQPKAAAAGHESGHDEAQASTREPASRQPGWGAVQLTRLGELDIAPTM